MGIEDYIYNPSILRQKDGELRQPDYRVNHCPRGTEESGERGRKRQAKTDRKGDVRVMVQMIKATAGKPSDLCLIPQDPRGVRRESTATSCPLPSTRVLWHACAHTNKQM